MILNFQLILVQFAHCIVCKMNFSRWIKSQLRCNWVASIGSIVSEPGRGCKTKIWTRNHHQASSPILWWKKAFDAFYVHIVLSREKWWIQLDTFYWHRCRNVSLFPATWQKYLAILWFSEVTTQVDSKTQDWHLKGMFLDLPFSDQNSYEAILCESF